MQRPVIKSLPRAHADLVPDIIIAVVFPTLSAAAPRYQYGVGHNSRKVFENRPHSIQNYGPISHVATSGPCSLLVPYHTFNPTTYEAYDLAPMPPRPHRSLVYWSRNDPLRRSRWRQSETERVECKQYRKLVTEGVCEQCEWLEGRGPSQSEISRRDR